MAKLRTFLAIEATNVIRKNACDLIGKLKRAETDVKWVEATQIHWTLKFIGEVTSEEVLPICRAASATTAQFEPFEIEVAGTGTFGSKQSPHVLWLGLKSGQQSMIELHDQLDQNLLDLGYRKEHRRYQPHLTLGRVSRNAGPMSQLVEMLEKHQDFQAGAMTVTQIVVFSSQLTKSGPFYQRLGTARLGKG